MPVAKRPSTDPPQWLTTVAPLRRVPALFHHPGGYAHELPSPGGESIFIYFYFFAALFFFALNFNFVAVLINFVVVHGLFS
ncbi:hypothetical protein ACP3BV_000357 [Escherichia coli]